ncbi:MAG: HD domain-containing protein [Actinomycetota bacterium]|jgi:HD-GYP domain-containing protein (c-di-GMP phosphodiesterase class II)|nr:HD domain-containing protein [Actinomycetota bacterium]
MSSASRVITAIASVRKAAQLYPTQHPSYREAMNALLEEVSSATSAGVFTLNVHQGHLYNESTVIADDAPGIAAMADALEVRRVESLGFKPGFTERDALALVEVLSLRPSPTLEFEQELESRGATAVVVQFIEEEPDEEQEERERLRGQDRALYTRLISTMRSLSEQVAKGSVTDLGGAGEMVGSILERLMSDKAAMLGMATIRGRDETDLFHSINVMIYALTLGSAMGLPEEGLASLGLSALLHDIGKAAFNHDDMSQLEVMRVMHPTTGAEILSSLPLDDTAPMLVAYEHHMYVDGSGVPSRPPDYVAHPFSRMVAVANRFAELTNPTPGAYGETPDRAIAQILKEAGSLHDPMYARLFAKALGVFPIGCLVRLSDMSVGVVSDSSDDPLAPVVRVVYDSAGLEVDEPTELALSDSDLKIVEVIDQDSLNTDVSDHL